MEGFCVCMTVAQGAHWLSRRPRRKETLIFTWSQKKPLSHTVFSVTAHKEDARS